MLILELVSEIEKGSDPFHLNAGMTQLCFLFNNSQHYPIIQSTNRLHLRAISVTGEQIQDDTVSFSLRKTKLGLESEPDGDAGENMVSWRNNFAMNCNSFNFHRPTQVSKQKNEMEEAEPRARRQQSNNSATFRRSFRAWLCQQSPLSPYSALSTLRTLLPSLERSQPQPSHRSFAHIITTTPSPPPCTKSQER
jgi:hypothetical protein